MGLELIGLQAILADENFQAGLRRYSEGVAQMETVSDRGASVMTKVWAVGGAAVAVGAAAVVTGVASIAAISKQGLDALTEWGNSLDALGDTLGTTGEQSSAWAIAMKQVGLNVEEGAGGLNAFIRNLDDGSDTMKKALQTLGVNMHDANGKLRTFDDLMPELMRAFSQMPDGVKKSALAMDLFGKSGTKFLDFLSQGDAGLEKAIELGKLYGLTMSSDMVQATQDFQNAMQVSKMGLQGFWMQMGRQVLPVANKFVNFINLKLLPPLVKFAQEVAPKLGAGLDKAFNVFQDLFGLLAGEDKLAQFARSVGDLASMFGLSETAVTDFVLKALTGLGQFKDWIVGFLPLLQKGDWGEVWKRLSDGVSNAWKTIQPILAEWGGKIWSWIEDAAAQIPARVGDFIGGLGAFLAEHGPGAWAQLTAWGSEFWNWLTTDALPKLGEAGTKFLTGIGEWISKNGPGTWTQLLEWGTKFWDWLSNPTTGAIVNAGVELQKVATAIGTWASTIWSSTIQPALAEWGAKFWDWLINPETGVVSQAADKLDEFSGAILKWSQEDETKTLLRDAGYNLAGWIIDAIGSFFDSDDGKNKAVETLSKLGMALYRAQVSFDQAKFNIGAAIGQGIYDRLAEWFTENAPKLSAAIYEWLNKAADDLLANLNTLAEKIGVGIAAALADFWKTHPLTLPSLQLPQFSPTSYIPATNGGAAQQIAALSGGGGMSLKVLIDGQEIKNAVMQVAYTDIDNLFGAATQQAQTN